MCACHFTPFGIATHNKGHESSRGLGEIGQVVQCCASTTHSVGCHPNQFRGWDACVRAESSTRVRRGDLHQCNSTKRAGKRTLPQGEWRTYVSGVGLLRSNSNVFMLRQYAQP
ncbi:hypothetical protein PHLGIDRAFT_20684 [Phlebiopsis gigantea 11061_1 CR5-6]|uniref:Uncharacterized protein n=1 Tax=Phlebiopsis gigantea (strain 11061_1 CR5-6) TaxID=745531 RepID=A0A0C3NA27_PHLG1|nr:hypothetical protein PHLGIDRAFT_20684 [Phlebiopsis gigantea 11061_1 CR5-6]